MIDVQDPVQEDRRLEGFGDGVPEEGLGRSCMTDKEQGIFFAISFLFDKTHNFVLPRLLDSSHLVAHCFIPRFRIALTCRDSHQVNLRHQNSSIYKNKLSSSKKIT